MPTYSDRVQAAIDKEIATADKMLQCRNDYGLSVEEMNHFHFQYLKSISDAIDSGFSQADCAHVLEISRQRVYQLLKEYELKKLRAEKLGE